MIGYGSFDELQSGQGNDDWPDGVFSGDDEWEKGLGQDQVMCLSMFDRRIGIEFLGHEKGDKV